MLKSLQYLVIRFARKVQILKYHGQFMMIQMYLDAYKSNRWSEYSNSEKELSVRFEKEYFNGLPKTKFQEAMRAEGIGFGDGIDSSLHLNPFIETYFNLRAFKRYSPKNE